MANLDSDFKKGKPIVSIVTVVKNHEMGLLETFGSLQNQSFQEWEMLIVVGKSTDKTLEVSNSLRNLDSRVNVLEQSDSGIYEAMNLGLKNTTGLYVWFMNAGDLFFDLGTLSRALSEILKDPVGVLIGGYQVRHENSLAVYNFKSKRLSLRSFAYTRRGGCHQAMLFRSEDLKQIGGYDVRYSLASDFDLVLRVIKKAGARRVTELYASVEPGGQADTGIHLVHDQKHAVRQENLVGIMDYFASSLWTFLARNKIKIRNRLNSLRSLLPKP
jgi:glycosyltransferase involved in cell wall biosynthesis